MANSLGIDPKKFKHVSSDDKMTVLQHKDGHQLRIRHDVLNPKMQEQLKALAKVPVKEANGGDIQAYSNPRLANPKDPLPAVDYHDKTTPEQDKARHDQQDKDYPSKPEAKEPEETGYADYAKGGKVESNDHLDSGHRQGSSTQGEIVKSSLDKNILVRNGAINAAKAEARGRADMERHVKPKLKGLAEGGEPDKAPMVDENGRPADMPSMQPSPDQIERPDMTPTLPTSNQPQAETPPSSVNDAPMTPIQPEEAPQDAGVSQDEINREAEGLKASTPPQIAQPVIPGGESVPAAPEPPPEPGNPMSARQQAIFQVQNAKATKEQQEENMKFAQDIQNGHISPKTYGQLFHDRSVPGKIGMIFGLMLGGIGAGMAHTQNAYLNMMDKTIANDLEAQKQSKVNADNFVKLNVANELNHAQTQLTQSSSRLSDANAALVLQNAASIGYGNASIQAYTIAAKKLKDLRDATPEGSPQRAAADAALAQFYQKFGEKITNASAMIAGVKAQNEILFGGPGSGATGDEADRSEQAFQSHQTQLLKLAQTGGPQGQAAKNQYDINESKHIPGIVGQASGPVAPAQKEKILNMNTLDKQLNNLQNAVKQYSAMSLKGNLDPKVLGPMAVKAHETAALYNQTLDGLGMTEGRMGWLDKQIPTNPQTFLEQLKGSKEKLEEVAKNNRMRRDMVISGPGGLGFPKQKSQEQLETKTMNGIKYQKVPGGWKKTP